MKLHQQYLLLHNRFGDMTEHEATLSELAELLDCTHRNTLTIVKKMAACDWIRWISQRGRGRRSTLTLLVPAEQIAAEYMMQALNRRELHQAAEQVRAFSTSSMMREHLNHWLLGYSGHHTEAGEHNERIDTLRLPLQQQLHALDPLYINLLAESFVTSHVFDGLVQRNEQGDIVPCLAHTWDVSPDRKTWLFHLRKGVLFHNGGRLTAGDVVHTFSRLQATERRTLYRDVSRQILSVEALNSLTVVFRLKAPYELFLSFLATSRAVIVPSDSTKKPGDDKSVESTSMQKPVGTGPFKVTLWDEHLCRLEAFPAYFQGRAHLDRVDILQIPWSAETEWGEHGEAETPFFHLVPNPAAAKGADWIQISAGVMVNKLLTCNTQKTGPLSDPAIRTHLYDCISGVIQSSENPLVKDQSIPLQLATIPQYRKDAAMIAAQLEQCGYACKIHTAAMEQFKGPLRMESDLILFSLIRDRDEELRRTDLYLTLSEHLDEPTQWRVQMMLQTVTESPLMTDRITGLDRIEQFLLDHHLMFHLSEKPVETAYLPSVRGLSFNSQGWVNLRHIWFPSGITVLED
ncbi:ABC transporter substrate-binding protein [Paenibacillus illinoisensis]|uniref:ABC transporter substrate-binding protein n=1 Tax=Paenibacillus illinoisensis TaxID=59845 RepID=UPI003D2E90F8